MPPPTTIDPALQQVFMYLGTQSSLISKNDQELEKVKTEIDETDSQIHTQRRQVFYDFETDMFENAKVFFLGNVLFICLIIIVLIICYRYFT